MAYSINTKNEAEELRKKGYSYNEISDKMGISKGTLSRWFKDLNLSIKAKKRLRLKMKKGQIVAAKAKKRRRLERDEKVRNEANNFVNELNIDDNLSLLLCSLIYICEGESSPNNRVGFSNSDPNLIKTFLRLFRASFNLEEGKFRVMLHLHDYHNKEEQKAFWSEVTDIPLNKFLKVYQKKNTKNRIRKNYPGCAHIRYHDTNIARKLVFTAETFLEEGA